MSLLSLQRGGGEPRTYSVRVHQIMGAIKLNSRMLEYGIPHSSFLAESAHLYKRGSVTPFPYESCSHTNY